MRGRPGQLLFVGALAALTVLTASASARPATPALHARTLTIHLSAKAAIGTGAGGVPFAGIALDGTKAAFVAGVRIAKSCQLGERLYRWNLATGQTSLVSGAKTCAIPETIGQGISEIALAGSHTAWVVRSGGNTERAETLFSSTARPRKDKVLETSDRFGDPGGSGGGWDGSWIGGLVSDGSRMFYSTWTTQADQTVTESELLRISGSVSGSIAGGTGAVVSASADGGRVALLGTDGTVAVYSSNGTILQTITGAGRAGVSCTESCPPGEAVTLTGNLVAVLTEAQPNRQAGSIKVYDRTSGELLDTWPAGGYSWQFDAFGGLAIYTKGTRIHALDLRTGNDVLVAKRGHTTGEARLDRAGLLYYVNGRWSQKHGEVGTLVFVPFRTIAAKLAG